MKKLLWVNKHDPKWIKEIAGALLDRNIDNLSDSQIRILRNMYLENLRDGLKPKEAMDRAYQIVTCFNV